MKTHLQKWFEDIATRHSDSPSGSGAVEGLRDQHLGPRRDFARVQVFFEPSPSFEVICTAPNLEELNTNGYLDFIVFGLLDVLLTAQAYPMRNVRLTITEAEIHPIHANQMAFRWAGRDAARKLLELLRAEATRS